MLPVRIERLSLKLPERVETAAELAPQVGRSEEWILSRTGVAKRHIHDGPVEELAAEAVRGLSLEVPPDLLINASLTPRQLIPDTSCFVMRELGWSGFPSHSVHATCLSFLVALQQAAALLSAGVYERVVVVSAERGSICRDFDEPESAVLIGDGAAAVLLTRGDGAQGLLGLRIETYPEGAELAELRGCGVYRHPNHAHTRPSDNLFHMRGPRLYRHAVPRVEALVKGLLAELHMSPQDIDLVVPHQASGPALAAIPRFGFDPSVIVNVVAEHGNCIAASMPMALAHASQQGRLTPGSRVLLLGTGAGLNVGAAILEL